MTPFRVRLFTIFALFTSVAAAQSVLIRVVQGNALTPVANGGVYTVNVAGVGQPRTFTVQITYLGPTTLSFTQGPQLIGSADFKITRPPTTTVLGANQSLAFDVQYTPSDAAGAGAEVDLPAVEATSDGSGSIPRTIALLLKGTVPDFLLIYKFDFDANARTAPPGGEMSFIDTSVNAATVATVTLVNRGSGPGQVVSMTTSGDAFSLASVPILPVFVSSGGTLQFQVLFRPRGLTPYTGALTVGLEGGQYAVTLKGQGISSYLGYTVANPGAPPAQVLPNAVIRVPDTALGQTSATSVTVKNTSSFDVTVNSIAISGTAFQLRDVPFAPFTLAPGSMQTFSILFSPISAGESKGRLIIGADAFELVGNGAPPQVKYQIDGPTSVQALDQPSIGLTLAAPQSVNLKGTLTLNSEPSSYASDPAVLFITGSKTAAFTIPAGSTKAIFSNGSTSLKAQVGTVAGTIIVVPAITTDSGVDVTANNPATLRMTLAADVPKLLTIGIATRSATGFTLEVTGLTTTRSMTAVKISFKGRPGYNLAGVDLTQDVSGASLAWFSSQASAAFGGQFVMQLPFSLSSTDSSAIALINALESATVSLANDKGASNSLTVAF